MMRIHTVVAGGASVLVFDGARYRVGPQSAGADPGPACYRRGGPLTVVRAVRDLVTVPLGGYDVRGAPLLPFAQRGEPAVRGRNTYIRY